MTQLAVRDQPYTGDQLDLIKRTVAKGADDDELALFLYTANSRGLDPLLKQIHGVTRFDKRLNRNVMSIQVGIDGYRLIADRTGSYAGNDDPIFDYPDNAQADAWPTAATVTVYKIVQGMRCPFTARARWDEYYPGDSQGFMWKRMPHTMLGKCAEALALRKAFPAETSGLYVHEEMEQAQAQRQSPEIIDATPSPVPVASTKPKMITTTNDRLYKRYEELAREAEVLEIAYEMPAVPIAEADLKTLGTELVATIKKRQAVNRAAELGVDEGVGVA